MSSYTNEFYLYSYSIAAGEGGTISVLDQGGDFAFGVTSHDIGLYTCNVTTENGFTAATQINVTVLGKCVMT